ARGELVAALLAVALVHPHDVVEPRPLVAVLDRRPFVVFAAALHAVATELAIFGRLGGFSHLAVNPPWGGLSGLRVVDPGLDHSVARAGRRVADLGTYLIMSF